MLIKFNWSSLGAKILSIRGYPVSIILFVSTLNADAILLVTSSDEDIIKSNESFKKGKINNNVDLIPL